MKKFNATQVKEYLVIAVLIGKLIGVWLPVLDLITNCRRTDYV